MHGGAAGLPFGIVFIMHGHGLGGGYQAVEQGDALLHQLSAQGGALAVLGAPCGRGPTPPIVAHRDVQPVVDAVHAYIHMTL